MKESTFADKGQILVGYDGSTYSHQALIYAAEEARLRKASVTVAIAWAILGYDSGVTSETLTMLERAAMSTVEKAASYLRENYPDIHFQVQVVEGESAYQLMELSKGADLLVVGARGRGGFSALLLGSVSDQLVHHASVPVVVVKS